MLKHTDTSGGIGSVFGASQSDYEDLVSQLTAKSISVVPTGNLSSAASRTVWVTLNATQFQALFNIQMMQGTSTIGPNNFNFSPGGSTPAPVNLMLYWNGALSPTVSVPLAGLWIERGDSTVDVGAAPTSVVTNVIPVALTSGAQGIGNSISPSAAFYSSQLAQIYGFPLSGSTVATPAIGLIENGVGDNTGVPGQTIGDFVQGYLQAADISGTATLSEGVMENPTSAPSSGERSLDVSVVAAASSNSNQVLYAGDGFGSFSSMQEAIWDTSHVIGSLSSSMSESARSTPESPFYAAYLGLMQDAALRNISVFTSAGDGGSSEKIGNGVPMGDISHDSPYAVVVGGTSLSTQAQTIADNTIVKYATAALAGDKATLRKLIAGGLKSLPSSTSTILSFIETTWNEYKYNSSDNQTNGLTGNKAGAGGIDTAFDEPSYQTAYSIDIPNLSYTGQQHGRGIPDVAALASGNTKYTRIATNGGGTDSDGGTSASAPLWAALTAQIQAIFADQGLPTTGFFNDLLYAASAVAPASFNDVSVGGNTSSFVYGGTTTDATSNGNYQVTPTGIGYAASEGYDLTTGLGTPNGMVLARALTQIAHAQMFSGAPSLTDPSGASAVAAGVLLVQSHLVTTGTLRVADQPLQAGAINVLQWTNQLAQQSLQSDFDQALVTTFDRAEQGATTQVTTFAGQALNASLDGTPASAMQASLTSPFGFVTYGDTVGNAVTLARPVAIAQTALGASDQEAIVRIRQDGLALDTMYFYRVDDLSGDIDGVAPGQAKYAEAAASRAYHMSDGRESIIGPGYGGQSTNYLVGISQGDIIASSLNSAGHDMWAFAGQNEILDGEHVNHIYNYGMNTWGYEDIYNGGDHDFNDIVFQLDFTSASGHGYLRES